MIRLVRLPDQTMNVKDRTFALTHTFTGNWVTDLVTQIAVCSFILFKARIDGDLLVTDSHTCTDIALSSRIDGDKLVTDSRIGTPIKLNARIDSDLLELPK